MDINNLRSILWDLRKCDNLMTESTHVYGHSMNIRSLVEKMEEKVDKAGILKAPDLKKKLKEIQEKCEKDNDFSKKTIMITRPDLIMSLFEAHETCGDKVASYFRSSFSSGDKLNDTLESTEKSLKKVDDLTDEVFSFKDEFSTHEVVSRFMELIKDMDELGGYFDIMDDILDSVKEDERIISSDDEDKDTNLTRNKLNATGNLSSAYSNLTFKIYNKTFEMVNHFVEANTK